MLSDSLTDFLTSSFNCGKNNEINYFESACIKGKCENKCEIKLEDVADDNELLTYVQYKRIPTTYFNKNGQEVNYQRTARVKKQH